MTFLGLTVAGPLIKSTRDERLYTGLKKLTINVLLDHKPANTTMKDKHTKQ